MRWYISGELGQQMEDFMHGDYPLDDTEILHLAKTDGRKAFRELIAEQEAGIQRILLDKDRDLNEICDLHSYSGHLVKTYQNVRMMEIQIEKSEKFLQKSKKKA